MPIVGLLHLLAPKEDELIATGRRTQADLINQPSETIAKLAGDLADCHGAREPPRSEHDPVPSLA
jgi:hypothetical protein